MGIVVHDGVGIERGVGPLEARRAVVRPHDWEVAHVLTAVASCHWNCGEGREGQQSWDESPIHKTYARTLSGSLNNGETCAKFGAAVGVVFTIMELIRDAWWV